MIICPNREKSLPVSFTISPVTQVALVAVKSASTTPTEIPLLEHCGRAKKKAPIRIVTRKLKIIICGGFNLRINILMTNSKIQMTK